MNQEERRWVSACLLAYANGRRSPQQVSMRGTKLDLEPGERFAMALPEGIFFGDLFEAGHRYTMSLNLPMGYDKKTATWWPPNMALGRTLDLQENGVVDFRGRCQDAVNWPLFGESGPSQDPVHGRSTVCIGGESYGECVAAGGSVYHPIYVYGPRLAPLAVVDAAPAADKRMQVLSVGAMPIDPSQIRECDARPYDPEPQGRDRACVGPYDPMLEGWDATEEGPTSICRYSSTWVPNQVVPLPARVRGLSAGQTLQVVLRLVASGPEADPPEVQAAMKEAIGSTFTAMIRYVAREEGRRVEVLARKWDGSAYGWAPVPSIRRVAVDRNENKEYSWLLVHPVELLADDTVDAALSQPALSIRIRGVGDGKDAPEMDAVGFVHGSVDIELLQ